MTKMKLWGCIAIIYGIMMIALYSSFISGTIVFLYSIFNQPKEFLWGVMHSSTPFYHWLYPLRNILQFILYCGFILSGIWILIEKEWSFKSILICIILDFLFNIFKLPNYIGYLLLHGHLPVMPSGSNGIALPYPPFWILYLKVFVLTIVEFLILSMFFWKRFLKQS